MDIVPFRSLEVRTVDRSGIPGAVHDLSRGVAVGTAHRFQGDECDVLIFSSVIAKGIAESAANWVETPHNLINV